MIERAQQITKNFRDFSLQKYSFTMTVMLSELISGKFISQVKANFKVAGNHFHKITTMPLPSY